MKFKELTEAYEILTDLFMKDLWDQGYDMEAIKEKVETKKTKGRDGSIGWKRSWSWWT